MTEIKPETDEGRRPTIKWAMIPVLVLIVLLAMAYYLFDEEAAAGPNQIALLFASIVAALIGRAHGWRFDVMGQAAIKSVTTGISAIFILLGVGSLIGTWAMSGTLVAMVYWGLQILSPDYFYFSVVLICAVVALCIGSSWTVAGTLGIGQMGVVVAVIALQLWYSPLWLRYFRFGPAEWLWRSLTYWKPQPLRR